ncbi:transposase [Aquitalea sp. LB_tupeE]|uniref:transposase n=1 Tax=Aquitalea sp. LB_tupeE TaxID=2748078 RepID=UPI0015C0E002|nr:transposase [Aquitalea sp. LB_tupeE]
MIFIHLSEINVFPRHIKSLTLGPTRRCHEQAAFPKDLKTEVVNQVTERGYLAAEVANRLCVSAHSLYQWLNAVTQHGPNRSNL